MNHREARPEWDRMDDSKARGLCRVLELSLEENASALSHAAARDVARLVGLGGLERLITVNARHAAARRPRELMLVLDRVRRLIAAAASQGSIAPFIAADPELLALAGKLSAIEWGPAESAGSSPLATVTLEEALGGRPAELGPAREATLRASVAAAVRAACDWLSPEGAEWIRVERHDDTLVLGLRVRHPEHLEAAGEVVGESGGSLLPSERHDGTWEIRVSAHVSRPTFLLVVQRGVSLALPWHAVLRLRMAARAEAMEQAPVLPAIVGGDDPAGERPAALMAHGLRRAWMFADRVVWRLAATPEPADMPPPIEGMTSFVRDSDGERWWIVDPYTLLAGIPAPKRPASAPPGRDPRGIVTEVVEVPAYVPAPTPSASITAPPALRVMPSLAEVRVAPEDLSEVVLPAAAPPTRVSSEVVRPATASALLTLSAADVEALEDGETLPAVAPGAFEPPVAEPWMVEPAVAEPTAAEPTVESPVAEPGVADSAAENDREARDDDEANAANAPSAPVVEAERPAALPPALAAEQGPAPASDLAPTQAAAPSPAPAAARAPARRALIAEDSIIANIFLQRLLRQRGFDVLSVDTCKALMEMVGQPDWTVVFVDVRLPDTQGTGHLRAVAEHRAALTVPFALVALTGDRADEAAAQAAGIGTHLRKPFEPTVLDARLRELSLDPANRS